MANAGAFWDNTYLLDIQQGSSLTQLVDMAGRGGYDLSNGRHVLFNRWYGSRWSDVGFQMLTQLSDSAGLLWGASTGERGPKFRIAPALRVGVVVSRDLTPRATLTVTLRAALGGDLRERPCVADYGAFGARTAVNCRLAASPLPPGETLRYLWRIPPGDRLLVNVRYVLRF